MRRILPSLALAALICTGCASAPMDPSDVQVDSQSSKATEAKVVTLSSPIEGSTISSPLSVIGTAPGTWFFEGNIIVELRGEDGAVIATTSGSAQGEWMTEEPVPFSATLSFQTDAARGSLVIRKDNPSGEPQFDKEYAVPVRF